MDSFRVKDISQKESFRKESDSGGASPIWKRAYTIGPGKQNIRLRGGQIFGFNCLPLENKSPEFACLLLNRSPHLWQRPTREVARTRHPIAIARECAYGSLVGGATVDTVGGAFGAMAFGARLFPA